LKKKERGQSPARAGKKSRRGPQGPPPGSHQIPSELNREKSLKRKKKRSHEKKKLAMGGDLGCCLTKLRSLRVSKERKYEKELGGLGKEKVGGEKKGKGRSRNSPWTTVIIAALKGRRVSNQQALLQREVPKMRRKTDI